MIEYQLNYDYITTILCKNVDRPYLECNGKCYLIDRLSEASKQSQDNYNVPVINIDDYPVSPIVDYRLSFDRNRTVAFTLYGTRYVLLEAYECSKIRPPIYC